MKRIKATIVCLHLLHNNNNAENLQDVIVISCLHERIFLTTSNNLTFTISAKNWIKIRYYSALSKQAYRNYMHM